MPDVLGEVAPDVRTEIAEKDKAMSFVVKCWSLSMRVSSEERTE